MISQILRIFFWLCLAFLLCYSADTPKVCISGMPDYNETLCSETCTKSMHANESYCSNFSQSTANTENGPRNEEVANPVALSGIMTSTAREGIHLDITTPNIDLKNIVSSAISLDTSLKGSTFASFCVLLFAYF